MSKDYRSMFVRDVELSLSSKYGPDEIALISNIVIKSLSNYEITERCTDIAVPDDGNEKLLRRYKACMMVDGKSERTIKIYLTIIRKLHDTIGKSFVEMGAYDVRFFLALCQERGISNRTLENYRAYFSSFFQWMADDGIIPKNPIMSIKPIKYKEELKKAFTDVEIDTLRGVCNVKERAMIEFLLSTGVRISELTEMKINDIDLNNLTVHVVHGKGDKERFTYLTPVAARYLILYLDSRNDDDPYLFNSRLHGKYDVNGLRRVIKKIGERANVTDVHPHRFRRTFATSLSRRGMEIQEIQKLLGHSDIKTTLVYVETDTNKIQTSYKRFTA